MNKMFKKWVISLLVAVCTSSLTALEWEDLKWQISPGAKVTSFDNEFAVLLGGEAGLVWNNWFFGGAYFQNCTNHKSHLSASDSKGLTYDVIVQRRLLYGGGVISYTYSTYLAVDPFLSLLVGGGGSFAEWHSDEIFILEPNAGLNLKLCSHLTLSSGLGYRSVFFSEWFPESWISSIAGTFLVKFKI